jgi:hypothetical protein
MPWGKLVETIKPLWFNFTDEAAEENIYNRYAVR